MENAVVGFMVNNTRFKTGIEIELCTTSDNSSMKNKVDKIVKVDSYYNFIKAINYYLISNKLYNALFINDNCIDFEAYCKEILSEDFNELVRLSGVTEEKIASCARDYNEQMNAIILFSEKEISAPTSTELYNLTMITGK